MDIKLEIQKMAKEIGISKIGFTTADDFAYLEKSLRLGVEEGRTTGFEHKNIEERIYPKLTLESAKTIISIAVAYPHKLPQQPQKTEFKRGKITPNSWGLDYHYVLQDKLKRLAEGIEKLTENFEYKAYSSSLGHCCIDQGSSIHHTFIFEVFRQFFNAFCQAF